MSRFCIHRHLVHCLSEIWVSNLDSLQFIPPMEKRAGNFVMKWKIFLSNPYKNLRLSLRKWLDSFQVLQMKYTHWTLQFINYISRILFPGTQIQKAQLQPVFGLDHTFVKIRIIALATHAASKCLIRRWEFFIQIFLTHWQYFPHLQHVAAFFAMITNI